MSTAGPDKPPDPRARVMTVAQVREAAGRDTEVMFNESARFYTLRRDMPGYDGALRLLRTSHATGRPVQVFLTAPHGDVIESVRDMTPS